MSQTDKNLAITCIHQRREQIQESARLQRVSKSQWKRAALLTSQTVRAAEASSEALSLVPIVVTATSSRPLDPCVGELRVSSFDGRLDGPGTLIIAHICGLS